MAKDLSSVGHAATGSREDVMDNGKVKFANRVEIEKADNGGYIVHAHQKREPRRGEMYSPYVEPVKSAHKNKKDAFKHASVLFDDDADDKR